MSGARDDHGRFTPIDPQSQRFARCHGCSRPLRLVSSCAGGGRVAWSEDVDEGRPVYFCRACSAVAI